MILKWGSYPHDQNSVGVRIRKRGMFDQYGRKIGQTEEWHIVGNIKATSQSEVTTKCDAIEAAYNSGIATDYKDLILYLDDGTTPTTHGIIAANTFGGTHVVDFGWISGPWKMRTEYANKRSFYAIVRAETRYTAASFSYRERLQRLGTGASRWTMMYSLNASPIPQNLNAATSVKFVQQGVAVGRSAYPTPPAALYPASVHGELTRIEYLTPEDLRFGNTSGTVQNTQQEKFGVKWMYVMEQNSYATFPGFPGIVM